MAFLLHILREDDLFIDVGANVGAYTILACAAIGANGYAFEPVPSTYRRLLENVHLNHLENKVKCFNLGVGDKQGHIAFTGSRNTANHVLAHGEKDDDAIQVEISTLDSILMTESPSVIKIDVEGYEIKVLEGALQTLKKPSLHSVIMEICGRNSNYGFSESEVVGMMLDHGFSPYTYDPVERVLVDIDSKELQAKNTLYTGNTLFIRNKAFVSERLSKSPSFSILGNSF